MLGFLYKGEQIIMAQNIFKSAFLSLLLISFLTACGNVRFSGNTSSSSEGTGNASSTNNGGNDPGIGVGGNNNGDDGSKGGSNSGGPTATPPPSGSPQSYSYVVPPPKNQVDFLLIIDNSRSISYAQDKVKVQMKYLAAALGTLNIDWQMCMTSTTFGTVGGTCTDGKCKCIGTGANRVCFGNQSGGTQYWGLSLPWSNYTPTAGTSPFVLNAKNSANNLDSIFQQTITDLSSGAPGTGDERGIKAAYNHFITGTQGFANSAGCYRPGASVSVIVMSDENERSVAGDCSQINTALGDSVAMSCFPLEAEDQPTNLLAQAKSVFGSDVHFVMNSIITDTAACRDSLNSQSHYDPDGCKDSSGNVYTQCYAPHYIGTKYIEAANLTNGGVASLCGNTQDLSNSMQLFANQQAKPTASVTLNCAVVPSSLAITLGGATLNSSRYSVAGATVTFNPALNQGDSLVFNYKCQ
jgi:hypothetical protein